ncbi:hypothetical protein HK098_003107 [Nowakowskiella sp. JEL0407]|nr:hypothetical protein HK098_003107 [Nowakowskiella sp. JEL0407]
MTFSVSDIPDLSGKVAIVTGGNTGLGFATVTELARKNAKVYLAARTPERAHEAISKIKESIPNANIEFLELNLADLKQVKAAAEKYIASGEKIDILVNNAGIMACPFELTKDGYESQFATNHLGHFLFTTTLLPVIEKSAPSRIVNLSSMGHQFCPRGGILFDSINDEKAMGTWQRYGQSKLANILFTKSLAEKLADKQVHVNAVHPGGVNTELARGVEASMDQNPSFFNSIIRFVKPLIMSTLLTPLQGALTQLYCATSEEIVTKNYRGQYFVPFAKLSKPTVPEAESKELRDKLWEFSEKIVQEKTSSA